MVPPREDLETIKETTLSLSFYLFIYARGPLGQYLEIIKQTTFMNNMSH